MAGLARPSASVHPRAALKTRMAGPSPASGMPRRSCEGGLGNVSNTAIPHAGLRVLPAVFPSRRPFRCRRFRRRLHPAAAQPETRNYYGDTNRLHAPAARSRRSLRPSHPPVEPQDGAVHFRRPQRDPHHRPRADRTDAAPGLAGDPRRRRGRRPRSSGRHQAPGAGAGRRRRQALRPILRQLPLARRHADQLQDDFPVDQAAARARGTDLPRADRIDQARTVGADARPRQARTGAGRHQGDGRAARHPVRDRHQQGSNRGCRGQHAAHTGRRDSRFELLARRYRLSDPGKRRCDAGDSSLLRSRRRVGSRRAAGRARGLRGRYRRPAGSRRTSFARRLWRNYPTKP